MTELSTPQRNAWSEPEFKRFWRRMADIFGLRWYEQNGPEPSPSWMNGLAQHNVNDVMAAIVGYETTAHAGYPPNLPAFLEEVRAARRRQQPSHAALPAPKHPPEKLERFAAGFQRLRDIIARNAPKYAPRKVEPPLPMNDDYEQRRAERRAIQEEQS